MDTPSTRFTLLEKLRAEETDDAAWAEFSQRYGPKIAEWCRAQRLAPQQVDELQQDVLIHLFRGIKAFHYDPDKGRFRAYLYTLTRNTIARWYQQAARGPKTGSDEVLRQVPAADDLLTRLEKDFDLERLYLAIRQVRRRVQPETWQAFQGTELEGRRAVDVGAELGMSVAKVNVYRSRVRALVRKQLTRWSDDDA